MLPDRWTPTGEGDGDAWQLSKQLAPLAAVKSRICVVSGLAVKVPNIVPHGSGCAGILSAADLQSTGDDDTFSAPSIDQVIAAQVGSSSIYRSIQVGASDCTGRSYNGPNSIKPAETDPFAFYERIFGDNFIEPGKGGKPDPRLGLRRSVLDAVMDDIDRLDQRLGKDDKARLEQHLEGVRELEQRLAILQEDPPDLAACERLDALTGDYADVDGRPQLSARSRIMSDMLAMTLACDQTCVFGHTLTDPVSDVLFPDASEGHHSLTHNEGGDQPEVNAIVIQIMEELAYTIAALDRIEEGDGTLLDSRAVLATSEVSLGQTHSIEEMPVILAGSACGYLKQDHHYRSSSGDNATKLLISLQRAMGMSVGSFGSGDAQASESLSGIEA